MRVSGEVNIMADNDPFRNPMEKARTILVQVERWCLTERTLAVRSPHKLLVSGRGLQQSVLMNNVKKTHRINPPRNRAAKKEPKNGVPKRAG